MLADFIQAVQASLFWEYRKILLIGLATNFSVFGLAAVLAVALGLVACLARLSPFRSLRWCGTFYAELFRNTPEYVLLVWVHFVPPLLLTLLLRVKVNFSPMFSAVMALGLASSGYFTETFRAGIQSIPRGQVEAARSTGLSGSLTFRWVIMPQAIRRILPEAMNQFISLLKSTTLVSLIAVPDLMYQVSMITQQQMRPMPLYSGAAGPPGGPSAGQSASSEECPMIIDCHTHVFQHWAGACGHESREVHWKYIQKNVTRPAAKVRRARDGAAGDAQALFRSADNSWAGLRDDIHFRVGPFGRLEYTLDGEDYYIQYMPVGMAEFEAPPELQLAQMSYVGVDHCVLQTGMSYGMMKDFNAFCQRQYPHKFTGLFQVDEPVANTPRWMQELDRARHQLGLRGIYYQLDTFSRYGFQWTFDDARFDGFWETLAAMRIPVFFEAASIPGYDAGSYIANMRRLDRLLTRFPRMRWLLVMGPPVQFFARGGRWQFPDEVVTTYDRENLQLEIMFPITWGGVWDYPYPEAQALIKLLRHRYGAHKLIWGSDMPNVERFCTYRQCLDYVLKYCDFLTAQEKELILGRNVADLCGIGL